MEKHSTKVEYERASINAHRSVPGPAVSDCGIIIRLRFIQKKYK